MTGSIADVAGVRVGHSTIMRGEVRTGVTAVIPCPGNLFAEKPVAAVDVLNGFGKSVGLMQVEELGVLETPILLTNTFGVGTCVNALIRRAVRENPEIGRQTSTVNPVVLECNDGFLNDIQAMAVTEADAEAAIEAAVEDFARGSVGAGTGMSAFGLKGGIGTASRPVLLDGRTFQLGALALANFGRPGDLRLPDGRQVKLEGPVAPERGSVIVVIAADVPLESRQLRRIARRAGAGLAWCGAFWGHGSGDVFLAFSTANRVPHAPVSDVLPPRAVLAEERIDRLFLACAEATRDAVVDALMATESMTGRAKYRRRALRDVL